MKQGENIQDILRKEGYESILNNAPKIFAESCDMIFSKFGDKIKEEIIKHIEAITRLPSKYVFPYYSIAKHTFSEIFGEEASKIVIKSIRNEILKKKT